jgi:hypothetical protein
MYLILRNIFRINYICIVDYLKEILKVILKVIFENKLIKNICYSMNNEEKSIYTIGSV